MSNVTDANLKKVEEPCKSCTLTASGQGKNREIWCNYLGHFAKLIRDDNGFWSQIPDCPKKTKLNDKESNNEPIY
jgi:hypothetical protein